MEKNMILSKYTDLPVIRVENNKPIAAGKIYLIIENTTLTLNDGMLHPNPRDSGTINSTVNILFESLANDLREKASAP